MLKKWSFFLTIGLIWMTFNAGLSLAQTDTILLPIGGGYSDTYDGIIQAAVEHAVGETVKILVLPTTYSTNADEITEEERNTNLEDAESRRSQIDESCVSGAPEGKTCNVVLLPIFTRPDALDEANLSEFTDDVAAVYILGGDQTVAMLALVDTPVETALEKIYQRGGLITGTSAGLSMLSKVMIGGYIGDFGPESGLAKGAVDVWNTPEKRGLSFGLENVVLEQHFWERARLPRLLNALVQPGVPALGIGIDTYTAASINNRTELGNVFGLYDAAVVDAETYGAAKDASFKNDVLSIHNVLFHLLAPGDFTYNLETRQPSVASAPAKVARTFPELTLPDGAGPLVLAGNTAADPELAKTILGRFVELTGKTDPTLIIVTTGFASDDDARVAAEAYGNVFTGQLNVLILKLGSTIEIPPAAATYDGVVLLSPDAGTIDPSLLTAVSVAWRSGKPLLLDNAGAAIAGTYYAAQGPTPEATDDDPYADVDYIQGAFVSGNTDIREGLGLLPVMIEPRVMNDYRWGRLTALAYTHPDTVAIGIPDDAALEISKDGATVIGTNGVTTLDFSSATLDKGTNDAFVVANGLLDTFAPGEMLAFSDVG